MDFGHCFYAFSVNTKLKYLLGIFKKFTASAMELMTSVVNSIKQ